MAEFWKSAPRVWCKQCNIFIRDTGFEKSQHEATAKHQGNLKRFLRDIHRNNEQQQREAHKAKSEVERLRQTVAGPSGAKDTGAAPWKGASPPPKPKERPASLDERKKQMAQLAEMGISIPEEFRGDMALTGDWQTVSKRVVTTEDSEVPDQSGLSVGVRKRKHEGDGEDEDQETKMFVSTGWGSRTREYPGAQDDEDLDALLESTKDMKKKQKPAISDTAGQRSFGAEAPIKPEDENPPESDEPSQPKEEEPPAADKSAEPPFKSETDDPAPAPAPEVVFKKRKPKAMKK